MTEAEASLQLFPPTALPPPMCEWNPFRTMGFILDRRPAILRWGPSQTPRAYVTQVWVVEPGGAQIERCFRRSI